MRKGLACGTRSAKGHWSRRTTQATEDAWVPNNATTETRSAVTDVTALAKWRLDSSAWADASQTATFVGFLGRARSMCAVRCLVDGL